ncbi:LamG-like jellyroll fold domain-containing protein [uncultured Alistipes sp.]|uniref:LamG-like jellyroll fold domain-containing protein n=1 Tax=uncultured Alistipes sp. TaxID=538949 RepID=UPI002804BCCB|nr:LamG-like jellyroll fold domain-containing protein [uncultured Alistipes sp.]
MNSLLYYYNNVQKMAAYRQAKRMQRGSKFGYGDISTYLCSAGISLGVSDFSIEYWGNAYGSGNGATPILFNKASFGSSSNPAYFQVYGTKLGQNNLNWVTFGIPSGGDITTDSLNFNYSVPDLSAKFHLVITREGKTIRVYIDNVLIASKEQSEIKDLGDLQLAIANSSDVGFVRVWNYALSADDVTAHYNNGDPVGYVVPKAMRYSKIGNYVKYRNINNALGSNTVEVEGDTYTDITITSGTSRGYPRFVVELAEKYQGAIRVEVDAECSDEGGIIIQPVEGLSGDNNASQTITQRGIYSFTGVCNNTQYLYHSFGDALNNNKTLRLYSYKAIYCGLLAEYLPQYLMYGRDDKSIATSWLDSAKQLPLSDESMEPLFQSIGGHDMAANGAPEILYYGPKPDSKGVTLSISPLKAVGVIYTPPISGDMSIQLFAYDDKAISDQTITLMGGAIGNTDVDYQLMVYGYEDGYVLSILASGNRLGDVIIGQQGVFSEDIILAVDNSNIRVYANGDFKGNIDTSGYNITLDTIVLTGDAKVTSLFRVFNKALTAEEVATLHNNGNPDAYVLPASMKQGDQRCVLEWLPANIIPDQSNTSTASEWLDTATVLPEDNVQPKITQSVGGYDGMFQGNPTIVY